MKIRRCAMMFNHVISAKANCKINEWYDAARELRNSVIKNGLYGTGPIIYQVSQQEDDAEEAEYIFHLPVSELIEMPDNDKYSFNELWEFEDGLVLRHAEMDEDIEESYALLRASAEAFELVLQAPFYNIYLDVYGDEGIIDIYAPIIKEGGNG
jgi:effector-binding domain-containing protein